MTYSSLDLPGQKVLAGYAVVSWPLSDLKPRP